MTLTEVHAEPLRRGRTPKLSLQAVFSWFLGINKRIARKLKPWVSPGDVEIYAKYDELVTTYAGKTPTPLIVDIGGGKHCSFAQHVPRDGSLRIVGVDISEEELSYNDEVDERRVADATKSLPFDEGEAGMIVSRTLVEHLSDVDAFVENISHALAPGGYTIHLVPGRNSLFALAGRAIPFPIAKRILHVLRPEMKGIVEFPVFYDRCSWRRFTRSCSATASRWSKPRSRTHRPTTSMRSCRPTLPAACSRPSSPPSTRVGSLRTFSSLRPSPRSRPRLSVTPEGRRRGPRKLPGPRHW